MPPKKKRKPTSKPGIGLQHLQEHFNILLLEGHSPTDCQFGHVALHYATNNRSPTDTMRWINGTFGFMPCLHHIQKVVDGWLRMNHLSRGEEHFAKFRSFCKEVFVVHYPVEAEKHSTPSATPSATPTPMSASPTPSNSFSFTDPGPSTQANTPPWKKLRAISSMTPRTVAMRKKLDFVSSSLVKERKRNQIRLRDLRKKITSMPYKVKQINLKIKRKERAVRILKQTLKEKKLEKMKQCKKEQKANMDTLAKKWKSELKRKLKEKDDEIKGLENEKAQIQERIAMQNKEKELKESKRDRKTFSTQTRMIVYDCLMAHVPTAHIPSLVKNICKRTGVNLNPVPQRGAVENMTRELGIITELQTAETAIKTKNITLGFDSTTQEGMHVNCIHLTTAKKSKEKEDETTPKTCHVIALDQLPGGTAEDYKEHILSSIDSLANVHSAFHNEDFHNTRETIIANIANTMTDRATVNHCTIQKLEGTWRKQLNELNCNLHPLDTVASSCRSELKHLECEKGALFGKDCIAANIICQLSKLRYRDGKGDPRGFQLFLKRNQLSRGLFPRYRGNRLHILFHSAGVIMQNRKLLLDDFLSPGNVSCGGLKTHLRRDLDSETAKKQLCVLGLLGKVLTGPWMTKFYVSAESEIDYTAAIQEVKGVLESVAETCKAPLDILSSHTDFFGQPIDNDAVFKAIVLACPRDDETRDMLIACLSAVIDVLSRQYAKYFALNVTEQLEKETESARLHNMDSEEMMGMFSAAKSKSPNATMDFISSKLRATKNAVVSDFLDKMNSEQKNAIVSWAIGVARKRRTERCHQVVDLNKEMEKREIAKKQKWEEKERRKIENMLKTSQLDEVQKAYPSLEEKDLADLTDILEKRIVGRDLCHVWFDAETQEPMMYYGRVEKLAKKNSDVYVIGYWRQKETYDDDAVCYDMNKLQLAADVVCGDLRLS